MKSKFIIEKARPVSDFIGREVSPGNVIAVSRSGLGSKSLEIYIVTAIRSETLILANMVGWKEPYTINPAGTRSYLSAGELQGHIVLMDNPLFAMENPQIKNLIRIADFLKDQKIFPLDYKLGQSVIPV